MSQSYFAHASAFIDEPCEIGEGTRIWHFCHVMGGARIGKGCNLGQNVMIAGGVVVGDRVKIQNNVSLYSGTTVDDDVFLGPSAVITNVSNPRAEVDRRSMYERTHIRRGATIGANSTIVSGVSGITIGRYAFIAAGAVVTKDVPDYALMQGVPAQHCGWMSRHGHRLLPEAGTGQLVCPESGLRYKEGPGGLCCLDRDADEPTPRPFA